ncbi:MAG: reverse transcriptase-like protein [Deltaproteobacteria bacterium]|nr:MAG: reverse transcriptase-like protein [Deltaproteobacteria bacterium]
MRKVSVWADGAARGNPGPAAAGVILLDESGNELAAFGKYLGRTTNNVAEYLALVAGLEKAMELGADAVEVNMDSELVVRQIQGRYRVRKKHLQPLWRKAMGLLGSFGRWSIRHVPREDNRGADALANRALDEHELSG